MKRKRESRSDQIPLKKPNSENSTEPLHLKIKAKLHSLFDGFVSDLQTISKEADPDLTILLDSHVSQFMNGNYKDKKLISVPGLDHSSLLQNFVHSAKSRISGLLKQKPSFVSNDSSLETTSRSCEVSSQKYSIDPLQVHISQKVHSLLSKACDKKLANGEINHPSENFIESELHGFSSILQDFINSAKRKLSSSLSNGLCKKIPESINCVVPKKSQLCGVSLNNSKGADYKCNSNSENFTRSKITSTFCPSNHLNTRKASLRSSKMYAPRISESDTLEEDALCIPDARNCKNVKGGMLFLEDAERVPEYLDLEIHSDVEDQDSSSDEDVIVLGEKRPTYEEITLEEDSDEEEDSAEKKSGENEELLFQCSQCEKAFRVESLLKFHVRMHDSGKISLSSTEDSSLKRRSDSDEDESTKSTKKHESSKRKDKENKTKSNPRSSQAKKSCQEKQLKHNKRKHVSKHS